MKNKTTKKPDNLSIAHYNHIWLLCIRATWNSLLAGDRQFANKCKAVWLTTLSEMKEQGFDAIALQLEDFTACNTVDELRAFMEEKTLLPKREITSDIAVLFPSQKREERIVSEEGEDLPLLDFSIGEVITSRGDKKNKEIK